MKIETGYKYFKFSEDNNDEAEVIRVISSDGITVEYFDKEKNKKKISQSELLNNYTMLKPDGVIIFSIVNMNENDSTSKDVIVAMRNIRKDASGDTSVPHIVCRQSIYDFFTNNLRKDPDRSPVRVGVSVRQDTCPANIDFSNVLTCTDIVYKRAVGVYLDDTLNEILSLFSHKKFNIVLETLSHTLQYCNTLPVYGQCKTLKELLEANSFMYDFRCCFGIKELPLKIGDIETLDPVNTSALAKIIGDENILRTYVTRYSKYIDLKELKRDYILATSTEEDFENVYIVGYDVIK